ncbi:hypothetical protein GGX14DRAFT_345619 [Mycena pura]|uniref:Peptidase S54 rhomboid domain-containing protein n=1 Tax=Mycena pura TaxID=153505 RepID=A0AAD6YTA6_9AGAR|nr:hypothetical protein GGX14DRAFT_345619 [Mycena pura]
MYLGLHVRRVYPRVSFRPQRLPQWPRRLYHQSPRHSRRSGYLGFLDDIPEKTVFWGIIGINGIVFAMSWWAKKKLTVEHDPAMALWMQKHFQTNWRNLSAGRIWTLFTSMFAHSDTDLSHILFNGFTFYFLAPLTLNILGSRHFLFVYLGGASRSQLWSIGYKKMFQNGRDPYSIGASAAIYSMMSFLAFQAPRMTLLLYGIIPVPIWLTVGGLFTYESYLTASEKHGTSDTTAHIGGILSGAGYFFLRRFGIF